MWKNRTNIAEISFRISEMLRLKQVNMRWKQKAGLSEHKNLSGIVFNKETGTSLEVYGSPFPRVSSSCASSDLPGS